MDYVTMQPVAAGYVLRPEAIESAYYCTGSPATGDIARLYFRAR